MFYVAGASSGSRIEAAVHDDAPSCLRPPAAAAVLVKYGRGRDVDNKAWRTPRARC